jgi:hydroxypyruvate isomerase
MQRLGMQMGVFVAHTIDWEKPDALERRRGGPRPLPAGDPRSVEVAKRVNARWMVVVPRRRRPAHRPRAADGHVMETLRRAAGILEPHNLTLLLEPLNTRRDHPDSSSAASRSSTSSRAG